MPVFQSLEHVSFHVNVTIEIHLMKCLQGYFVLPTVFGAVAFAVELEVVLHAISGVADLCVLPSDRLETMYQKEARMGIVVKIA